MAQPDRGSPWHRRKTDHTVEQPTKFELALGLTLPQSLLVRADEVIE